MRGVEIPENCRYVEELRIEGATWFPPSVLQTGMVAKGDFTNRYEMFLIREQLCNTVQSSKKSALCYNAPLTMTDWEMPCMQHPVQ